MLRTLEGIVSRYTSETTASQPEPEANADATEPEADAATEIIMLAEDPKATKPNADASAEPKAADEADMRSEISMSEGSSAAVGAGASGGSVSASASLVIVESRNGSLQRAAPDPRLSAIASIFNVPEITASPSEDMKALEIKDLEITNSASERLFVFAPITERVENIGQLGPARTGRSAAREVLDSANVNKIKASSLHHLLENKENVNQQQQRVLPMSKHRADSPNAKALGIASFAAKENYADARQALKPTAGPNVPPTLLSLSKAATDMGATVSGVSDNDDTEFVHINNDDLLVKVTAIKTANSEFGTRRVYNVLVREGYAIKYERIVKIMRDNHLMHPA